MAILLLVKRRQIVQRLRDVGMAGTKRRLADRQRPFEQRLGIGIALLALVQRSQIVQLRRCFRRVEAEHLFLDRYRSLVHWLGLGVAALVAIKQRQIVQRPRNIAVHRTVAFSMSASRRCARGGASEYLPARLSSSLCAARADTFCAEDGAVRQALAMSPSHSIRIIRLPDFM